MSYGGYIWKVNNNENYYYNLKQKLEKKKTFNLELNKIVIK